MFDKVYRFTSGWGWAIVVGKALEHVHFGIICYPAIILRTGLGNDWKDSIPFPSGTLLPYDCSGNSEIVFVEVDLHKGLPKAVCKAEKKYLRLLVTGRVDARKYLSGREGVKVPTYGLW